MNHVRVRATTARLSEPHSGPTMWRKWRVPTCRHTLDRRRVIVAGSALVAASAIAASADGGLAPAADLLAATRKFLDGLEPDKRKAASFAWNGRSGAAGIISARRLHQAGPAAGADERGAEGRRLGSAGDAVVAGRPREGAERHDAAGRAGGERQRRRPALVGAVLVRGLRHAGRDRRVGLPARRPSSDPIDRRARRPHRLGHAVLVLGAIPTASRREACRAWSRSRTRRRWRGG